MTKESNYKPVKHIGEIPLNEGAEARVYLDQFKGHNFMSIRTFISKEDYQGPTKAGVTMNAKVLAKVIDGLDSFVASDAGEDDKEIARVEKKKTIFLVVRVTHYKDTVGIDIREFSDDPAGYQGWTKKGLRLDIAHLDKLKELLSQAKQAFNNASENADSERRKRSAEADESEVPF